MIDREWQIEAQRMVDSHSALVEALKRNRTGMRNILGFRKITSTAWDETRYGALTREEIEQVIGEITAALKLAGEE